MTLRARNGMTACDAVERESLCREPGHVILYASAERFGPTTTRPGQKLGFCLRHGGELYDVIRAWRSRKRAVTPTWLVDDLKADRLPRVTPLASGWSRTPTVRERRWGPSDFQPSRRP